MTWGDIYNQVSVVLLENSGFTLGLITDAQFWLICGEVLTDFLATTGISRKIFANTIHFSIDTYPEPEAMTRLLAVTGGGLTLTETSGFFLDNSDSLWPAIEGQPDRYREDEMFRQVQIIPSPNIEGNAVTIDAGQAGFGTLATTLSGRDFVLSADYSTPQGFGVIAGFAGNPYVEAINPGFGVPESMIPSSGNLQMFGTGIPLSVFSIEPTTFIEAVPDSLTPYLKYGILARIFSSDTELRDEAKATWCQARYQEGLNALASVIGDDPRE